MATENLGYKPVAFAGIHGPIPSISGEFTWKYLSIACGMSPLAGARYDVER